MRCQHSSDKQFHPRGLWNHFPKSGRSANCRGHCFAVSLKTILGSGLCKVAATTCTPAESQVSIDRRADCATVPRASEKTHKQTSTFYIYRSPHFQLCMSLAQSPRTHVTSLAADNLHWQDECPPSPRDWPVVSTGLCHAAGTPKQNMDSGPRNTRGFLNNVRQASISTCHSAFQKI